MVNKSHQIVLRGFLKDLGHFVNLSDDYAAGGENWTGTREEMVERLIEYYGPDWEKDIEIQKWKLSEERIEA